jgi:glutaredoxin-like protein
MLQEKEKKMVAEILKRLERPVKLVYFTQELECPFCRETHQLVREISELSEMVSLEVYNFQLDKQKVEQYRVDKIPATVIEGQKDYGVRYFGAPVGYEFATFLADMVEVSKGRTDLKPETKEFLKKMDASVHLQVFVNPTCPYCPRAVSLAHKFAIESDHVTADMVESTEFPHLLQKYQVFGVPKTVINEEFSVSGAVPEEKIVEQITKAIQKPV